VHDILIALAGGAIGAILAGLAFVLLRLSAIPGDVARHDRRCAALNEDLERWVADDHRKLRQELAASRIFKFARRRCKWRGDNPFEVLERGERARVSEAPERRVHTDDELAQVLAATTDRWRTLFKAASYTAGRESELLGWWWEDLDLDDFDTAGADFRYQVSRDGERVRPKTEESKSRVPLSRAAVLLLRKHKADSKHTRPKDYVFCTADGAPLHQRNVLRALYRAQERARKPDGTPTFPELFEQDARGGLVVNTKGRYVLNDVPRKHLNLPHFHSLRHGAAMDCDDAEEARDLLRHKNTNVTNQVYRPHFSERRREALRAKLNARQGDASTVPG